MKTPSWIGYTLLVAGCCASKQETVPWNTPRAWSPSVEATNSASGPWPEHAEDILSTEQRERLDELRRTTLAPVPTNTLYAVGSESHSIYTNWFFRGYTFSKASGIRLILDWQPHDGSESRRATIDGWLEGQQRAEAERMDLIFMEIRQQIEPGRTGQ